MPAAGSRISVKVEGLGRLERTLKAAGAEMDDLKGLHAEVGGVLAENARPLVAYKSGALQASIRSSGTKGASVVRAGGGQVPYAGVQEFGWPARNIPAQPGMTTSLMQSEDQIIGLYETAIDKVLGTVKGA